MKVGVIIPDRGDRKPFLDNCLRMIKTQTLQPDYVLVVDFDPTDEKPDITKRYRVGYEVLSEGEFDVIALMENDDWYSPEYLEIMVRNWELKGKPDIFGTDYTIYYHLKLKKHFTMEHYHRSSAMSTLIKPNLDFEWCPDHEVYTDIHLWQTLKGLTFRPEKHICIGMKHGIGKCGGRNHIDRLDRYVNQDDILSILDSESFKFYSQF